MNAGANPLSSVVPIKPAIYLVMGANIGTTVTNTIVSMGQSMDRKQFRRAFAGATGNSSLFVGNMVLHSPLL